MVGDRDINLHPSHISDGVSKVSLFHVSLLVCVCPPLFYDHTHVSSDCLIPISFSATRSSLSLPLRLNPLLVETQADRPNMFYDLRNPQIEEALFLPYVNRLPNAIDFCQWVTSPPLHHMTLWHRKLPWHIVIEASQPNGITVYDLFRCIHQQLHQSIAQEDYYTDALAPGDREELTMAFQLRCTMFPDPLPAGVRRIDFLGQEVCFIGLKRGRGGRWEVKTRLQLPKERMTIVGYIFILFFH